MRLRDIDDNQKRVELKAWPTAAVWRCPHGCCFGRGQEETRNHNLAKRMARRAVRQVINRMETSDE